MFDALPVFDILIRTGSENLMVFDLSDFPDKDCFVNAVRSLTRDFMEEQGVHG